MKHIKQNIGFLLLVLVLLASLALNVRSSRLTKRASRPIDVTIGARLAAIPILDAQGISRKVQLEGKDRSTILYVLRPSCPWCAANLDNIRTLAREAGKEYQFVGLSTTLDGLAEQMASAPLPFPIYVIDKGHFPKGFAPKGTPEMVLVDRDGLIQRVWRGLLAPQRKNMEEVEDFFHVRLPGPISRSLKPSDEGQSN